VVEPGARLVGWVFGHELIHPDGERTRLLYALDVDKDHRCKGYARLWSEPFVQDDPVRRSTEVRVLTDHDNDRALAGLPWARSKIAAVTSCLGGNLPADIHEPGTIATENQQVLAHRDRFTNPYPTCHS
jgi:hypothetical protein